MVWTWFRENWLVTRHAAKLFLVSTLLVLSLTPLFLGWIDPNRMSFWPRLPLGILWTLAPVALLFLYFGMWRYWIRIDNSSAWLKRMWFIIMLVGLWWGSCLYCYFVYLPQVSRRARAET